MDRQAWIAVTLCVLGLIGWQYYMATQMPPAVAPQPSASPVPELATATAAPVAPTAAPVAPADTAATTPVEAAPEFAEKIETLRNADLELRLTNRGGGIKEADLLNHRAANGQGDVVLNRRRSPADRRVPRATEHAGASGIPNNASGGWQRATRARDTRGSHNPETLHRPAEHEARRQLRRRDGGRVPQRRRAAATTSRRISSRSAPPRPCRRATGRLTSVSSG